MRFEIGTFSWVFAVPAIPDGRYRLTVHECHDNESDQKGYDEAHDTIDDPSKLWIRKDAKVEAEQREFSKADGYRVQYLLDEVPLLN